MLLFLTLSFLGCNSIRCGPKLPTGFNYNIVNIHDNNKFVTYLCWILNGWMKLIYCLSSLSSVHSCTMSTYVCMWCAAGGYFVGITDKINGIRRALNRFQTGVAIILLYIIVIIHRIEFTCVRTTHSIFGVSNEFRTKLEQCDTHTHSMHLVNFAIFINSHFSRIPYINAGHDMDEHCQWHQFTDVHARVHVYISTHAHTHSFGQIRRQTWALEWGDLP